jgi:RimJ/RimL family protein N-acetyltransferase
MRDIKKEEVTIRRATPDDAGALVGIWRGIVDEKVYSAVDQPFTVEQERNYLSTLSDREATFVAEMADGQVVGFQSLDAWTKLFHSMDHVAQLGTFIVPQWRGRGIGAQLAFRTLEFARSAGYEKLVIYVRASNIGAQAFYSRLGFVQCGRLQRQLKIDGRSDDEILMEMFLPPVTAM